MRVVIADANLPGALALIRELGEAGHEVWAVCEGGKQPLGLHSKHVARGVYMSPGLTVPAIRESLLNLLHDSEKPVFIPLSRETIELVSHRKQFFDLECHTLVPDSDMLAFAQDKRRIYKTACDLGIPIPAERHFLDFEKVADFARRQPLPAVLKYHDGEKLFLPPARRYTVVNSARALHRRYNIMHDVQSPVLVQDFVPGRTWGVGLVLDRESRPAATMCHERVRQYPATGGPGTLCRSVWLPGMANAAAELAAALRLTGFAYMEFKAHDKKSDFTLIDVSPRAWHSLPLCRASNLMLGQAYVDAALGMPPGGLYMRYDTGVEMQFVLEDYKAGWSQLSKTRHPGWLWHAMKDSLRPATKRSVFETEDRGPFLSMFATILKK